MKSPKTKYYLGKVTTVDGEHEHKSFVTVKAPDLHTAENMITAEIILDDCGLDAPDSMFGWGDGCTATQLKGVEEIKRAQFNFLKRHNVAFEIDGKWKASVLAFVKEARGGDSELL
jgi:hypothetical protein